MFPLSFFLFSLLLGLHLWHMEITRLGVQSELQLPAYTTATATSDLSCICNLHHSSWQCQILNPLNEARDRTPNLEVLVGFISTVPQQELPLILFLYFQFQWFVSYHFLFFPLRLFFFFFGLFIFLVLHPRHMWPTPQPHRTQATSATYTTAHSNAGSLTHWARPGIEPVSSWILARFVSFFFFCYFLGRSRGMWRFPG